MGEKMQRRLLSLLVVATFVALQVPLKRFVAQLVPGRRGPREDVAEALVQGTARATAVILASTLVRGLAGRRRSGSDGDARKGGGAEEAGLKITLDL